MTWKDILKTEKAHCNTSKLDSEKEEFEKKLIGNQKRIDADKDGKITGNDFEILSETKKAKAGGIRELILREIQKEGGALGYSHLNKKFKQLNPSQIKDEVMALVEDGKAYIHGDGDIISIKKPSKGRGFTR